MSDAPPPRLPNPYLTWSVVAVLAVIAAAAILIAARAGNTGGTTGSELDTAVERLVPGPGDQEPRQTRVGIDLAPGWWVEQLVIDGVLIPEDQWSGNEELFQVFFDPGPDKEYQLLDPGDVCVIASIYRLTDDTDRRPVSWCFRAI